MAHRPMTAARSTSAAVPAPPGARRHGAPWAAVWKAAAAAAGLVLLSACGSGMSAPGAAARTVAFDARLSGQAEVPPNTSPGTGTVEARFDPATRVLTWTVTYANLTGPVTAAHFHGPALVGQNAGVALPFAAPLASPVRGQATLTDAQVQDLVAGKWYANIHTAAHPAGEVRAQLAAPQR